MQLVKYFAGSRAMGNFSWNSDLDFVRIYTQSFQDIFAGVPVETWDMYPKDLADMYEVVKFMSEILWSGNSYLHAVMMANKKESCSDLWHKWEDQILEISLGGIITHPYNRDEWINRNIELIKMKDDVVKRVAWCYYWLLQSQTFAEDNAFILDIDTLLEYNDKTHARMFWDLKRDNKEEYTVSLGVVLLELQGLIEHGSKIQHPYYEAMWEDENEEGVTPNMKNHMLARQICLEARSYKIEDYVPEKWGSGYR